MTANTKKMDIKKAQTTHSKELPSKVPAEHFLGDVKAEFKKITWTSPEELKTYTKVVVGATFAVALGVYLIDLTLQTTLNTLEYLIKVIIG